MAVQRLVYLVTYSQADLEKFPDRAGFANIIVNSFQSKGVRIVQWVVSLEAHQLQGHHYHVAVKLSRRMRFAKVLHDLIPWPFMCIDDKCLSSGRNELHKRC